MNENFSARYAINAEKIYRFSFLLVNPSFFYVSPLNALFGNNSKFFFFVFFFDLAFASLLYSLCLFFSFLFFSVYTLDSRRKVYFKDGFLSAVGEY